MTFLFRMSLNFCLWICPSNSCTRPVWHTPQISNHCSTTYTSSSQCLTINNNIWLSNDVRIHHLLFSQCTKLVFILKLWQECSDKILYIIHFNQLSDKKNLFQNDRTKIDIFVQSIFLKLLPLQPSRFVDYMLALKTDYSAPSSSLFLLEISLMTCFSKPLVLHPAVTLTHSKSIWL